ncbi:MAG: fluoride efflux transporter CrcB [Succinivibrionaceae bacterium]
MNSLLVFLGGGIGAFLRFLVIYSCSKYFVSSFPFGTLIVNLIGCSLIGLIMGVGYNYMQGSPSVKMLVITGVLGGFTTFSSFALDFAKLCQNFQITNALIYLLSNVIIGILLTIIFLIIGQYLTSK